MELPNFRGNLNPVPKAWRPARSSRKKPVKKDPPPIQLPIFPEKKEGEQCK